MRWLEKLKLVMFRPTTSLTKCFGAERSPPDGHQNNLHQIWKNLGTLFSTRDKASQQEVVTFFLAEIKEVPHNSVDRENWCSHFSETVKVQSRTLHVQRTTTDGEAYCDLLEKDLNPVVRSNVVVCSVLVCYYSVIKHGLWQHVQQLRKLWTCVWSVFRIIYIHPTSYHMVKMYRGPQEGPILEDV